MPHFGQEASALQATDSMTTLPSTGLKLTVRTREGSGRAHGVLIPRIVVLMVNVLQTGDRHFFGKTHFALECASCEYRGYKSACPCSIMASSILRDQLSICLSRIESKCSVQTTAESAHIVSSPSILKISIPLNELSEDILS